jgi:aerobic carbon-monoxide dehydrogenase small subunit
MKNTTALSFNLNNTKYEAIEVPTCLTLADLLREEFGLRGTNLSCSQGVCGSCTVIIDGNPIAACHTFAFEINGKNIRTIEGLESDDGTLDPVQASFAESSAFQCGYCTPGMIMLSRALLDQHENPSEDLIKEWISSNICRCTGYSMIIEAVQLAAIKIKKSKI